MVPEWRELFFSVDGRLMAVEVETEPDFRAGAPKELFRGVFTHSENWIYDVPPTDTVS